jgi:hypothetical protein
MAKPILCVDFDGVIHSYSSGWQGADIVNDPPTPGALAWLAKASDIGTCKSIRRGPASRADRRP